MKNDEEKQFYSVAEVAKAVGVSRVTIFNRIKKGEIPAKLVGNSYVIENKDFANLIISSMPNFRSMIRKYEEIKKTNNQILRSISAFTQHESFKNLVNNLNTMNQILNNTTQIFRDPKFQKNIATALARLNPASSNLNLTLTPNLLQIQNSFNKFFKNNNKAVKLQGDD